MGGACSTPAIIERGDDGLARPFELQDDGSGEACGAGQLCRKRSSPQDLRGCNGCRLLLRQRLIVELSIKKDMFSETKVCGCAEGWNGRMDKRKAAFARAERAVQNHNNPKSPMQRYPFRRYPLERTG